MKKTMTKKAIIIMLIVSISVVAVGLVLGFGIYYGIRPQKSDSQAPDVTPDPADPSVPDDPTPSQPSLVLVGRYVAAFWGEDAVCVIKEGGLFAVESNDSKLLEGEYTNLGDARLQLLANGQEILVDCNVQSYTMTLVDVTQSESAERVYYYDKDNERYRLSLFSQQRIKLECAKGNASYAVLGYGFYSFDSQGRFVAKYSGLEWLLVLSRLSNTFTPYQDKPEQNYNGVYRFVQKGDAEQHVYTLMIDGDLYRLEDQLVQNEEVRSRQETMGFWQESNGLIGLENGRLARIFDEQFVWCIRTVNTVTTSRGQRTFQLLLEEKENYDCRYEISEVIIAEELHLEYEGTIVRSERREGLCRWTSQEREIWVYLDKNDCLTPIEVLQGEYYTDEDGERYDLTIDSDGSYSLVTEMDSQSGKIAVIDGNVVIADRVVELEKNTFVFGPSGRVVDCNLGRVLLVGQNIDYTAAFATVQTVWGEENIVPIVEGMVANYNANTVGERIAILHAQGLSYRFTYEVVAKEKAVSFVLSNFPQAVMQNESFTSEYLFAKVTTNIGNTYTAFRDDIEIIGFDSSTVGVASCQVRCAGITQTIEYEVITERVLQGMRANGLRPEFDQGEEMDLSGAYLTLIYNYGGDESTTITPAMVTLFDTQEVGDHVAIISYQGKTVHWEYSVRRVFSDLEIKEGQTLTLYTCDELDYDHLAAVYFVPIRTGAYVFSSASDWDTIGYLLDQGGNLLVEDDDSGRNLGFLLSYELQEGQKYRLVVWAAGSYVPVQVTLGIQE